MSRPQAKRNVDLFKTCLNMESEVRVLCDLSYIRYLFKQNQDPFQLHAHICKRFGVNKIKLFTTRCFLYNIRDEAEKAESYADAAYWKGLEDFASQFKLCCMHPPPPVKFNSGECLKDIFYSSVMKPFLVGTKETARYVKYEGECGLPALLATKHGIKLVPSRVHGDQRMLLENMSLKRDKATRKRKRGH